MRSKKKRDLFDSVGKDRTFSNSKNMTRPTTVEIEEQFSQDRIVGNVLIEKDVTLCHSENRGFYLAKRTTGEAPHQVFKSITSDQAVRLAVSSFIPKVGGLCDVVQDAIDQFGIPPMEMSDIDF
jgi:hypothetical protein